MREAAPGVDRATYIGGPDAAAILGVNPYRTPYQVWAEKTGRVQRADLSGNEAVRWGNLLEPIVGSEWAERTNRALIPGGFVRHAAYPFLAGTPDFLAEDADGLIVPEVKTTGFRFESDWTEDAPVQHQIQAQFYATLLDVPRVAVVALIGGQKLVWAESARNVEFCDRMVEHLTRWWRAHIVADVPPAIDGSERTADVIAEMYPADNGDTITLPADAMEWDAELVALKAKRREMDVLVREYENQLKAAMGAATKGVLPNGAGLYTYKTQSRAEYTAPATTFRVLRRKGE